MEKGLGQNPLELHFGAFRLTQCDKRVMGREKSKSKNKNLLSMISLLRESRQGLTIASNQIQNDINKTC